MAIVLVLSNLGPSPFLVRFHMDLLSSVVHSSLPQLPRVWRHLWNMLECLIVSSEEEQKESPPLLLLLLLCFSSNTYLSEIFQHTDHSLIINPNSSSHSAFKKQQFEKVGF